MDCLGDENMAYSLMMIIAAVLVWQYMMLQSRGKLIFKPIGYSGSYDMYIVGCLLAPIATHIYSGWLGMAAAVALVISLLMRAVAPIAFARVFTAAGEGAQIITMAVFFYGARIGYGLAAAAAIAHAAGIMID